MVRTVADVPYVVSILSSPAYEELDRRSQSVFVARSLQHFLMVKHFVAARELVTWFCTTQTHINQAQAFERLFRAVLDHGRQNGTLSSPPPELVRALTDDLLVTMRTRGVKHSVETYRSLLHPSIIGSQSRHAMSLLQEIENVYGLDALDASARQSITEQAMQAHSEAGHVKATDRFGQAAISGRTGRHSSARRTMMLRARRFSAADAVQYFEMLLQTPEEQRNVDEWTWTSLFSALADDDSISTESLLRALQRMEQIAAESDSMSRRLQHSRHMYHALLRGLLIRDENELVLRFWDSLRQNGLTMDGHLVDVVARALCALDREDEAIALLRDFSQGKSPQYQSDEDEYAHGAFLEADRPQGRDVLDAVPHNNLMVRFRRKGEFARVWSTFNLMQTEHKVKPDATSITIVLDAARYASAAAGKGYGPGLEAINVERGGLKDDSWHDPESTGFLRKSAPACRVAERLAWRVLESNWPRGSEQVTDPMEGGFSMLDWLSTRSTAKPSSESSSSKQLDSFKGTLSLTEPLKYPQVFPTERFFRSFIQLIGYHSSPRSVALVLAWMRYVGVKPTHSTLTLAFMYIGEAGLEQAKMDRLRKWCEEWLGTFPTEEEVARVRRGNCNGPKPPPLSFSS
ncbi:hypothetical protein ACM66B_006851 [Microbotryomycetes sp. NB124-2]